MPAFVFASIHHAGKHLKVDPEARWSVTFINNETLCGKITEIRNGSYLLEEDTGAFCYFDARKVLYMRPPVTRHSFE